MSDNQMSPDASPGEIGKKAGVRRVNNWPLLILGGVVSSVVVVIAVVAAEKSAEQQHMAEVEEITVAPTTAIAAEIIQDQPLGLIEPEERRPPMPKPLNVSAEAGQRPQQALLPVPPDPVLSAPARPPEPALTRSRGRQEMSRDDEAERIRMAKLEMLRTAATARTGVDVQSLGQLRQGAPAASNAPPRTRNDTLDRLDQVRRQLSALATMDPAQAYMERLAQARAMNQGGQVGASNTTQSLLSASAGATPPLPDGDRWQLDTKREAPGSAYELRAGFVVPGILMGGINSELPGQILGQVSQDVYDTATGDHLLIPQGARLVGSYASDVAYGQARVLVKWDRIVFPDGKALDIGSMPGTDGAGYSGFSDQVNNHYLRIFGSAFLMSGITAGIAFSQDRYTNEGEDGPSFSGSLSESLGQQLGEVTAQLIAKNLSIAPTLEIRPGYRFNIIVTRDLTFQTPYNAFDYR